MKNKENLIKHFGLQAHPEGGYYVETYKSSVKIMPPYDIKTRAASTDIYYLLGLDNHSKLHKLKADEMWHFYDGLPLTVVVLDQTKEDHHYKIKLGKNYEDGEVYQSVVPADHWFGSYIETDANDQKELSKSCEVLDYSLVGCTVTPGFEFGDFEVCNKNELLEQFPRASEIIEKLS
jgi:predicted cupin superfamily sugar epimerase